MGEMKYCTSCGKKIDKKTRYCVHCGQDLQNEAGKKSEPKTQKSIILVTSIFFVGLLSLIILLLIQSSGDEKGTSKILPKELTESVVDIINPSDSGKVQQPSIRREGYSLDDKPFDNRNYAYDERTKDFRLVCTNPCPVTKSILDQEFAAISYAVSTARGLTKTDIDGSIMPFEVHASEDEVCPMIPSALAYMSTFTDGSGYTRGKLCFFFDKINYNRDKFPYSTSVHEVMHLFEVNKVPHDNAIDGGSVLWEGLSEMMESFFLKGNERNSFCWQGNAWYKNAMQNSHDPHWVGGDLFFELCNQYGFDYDDLPTLFKELEGRGGNTNEREFVNIVNNIVGTDTSNLFRKAGVI